MAMIKCPECAKDISDKTYKCLNCGVVINKPRRGITGIIFKFIFILFNAIMIIAALSFWYTASTATGNTGGTAGAFGTGILLFTWILIGLPLGVMSYITRPKAYE